MNEKYMCGKAISHVFLYRSVHKYNTYIFQDDWTRIRIYNKIFVHIQKKTAANNSGSGVHIQMHICTQTHIEIDYGSILPLFFLHS